MSSNMTTHNTQQAGDPMLDRWLADHHPARPVADPGELASLRQSVLERVNQEDNGFAATWRQGSSTARLSVVLVLFVALMALLAVLGPRPDLHRYPVVRLTASLAIFTAAALSAWWLVLRPLHRPAPSRVVLLSSVAALVLGPLGLALLPDAHTGESIGTSVTGASLRAAVACLLYGTVVGSPLLLLVRVLDRGGFQSPVRAFLALGAASVVGNAALQLHCPGTEPMHLLLGHAGVMIPYLAAWAFLWRRH